MSQWPVDTKLFQIRRTKRPHHTVSISYKGILLWNIMEYSNRDQYRFYLTDQLDSNGRLSLVCEDEEENLFRYGDFQTQDEARAWLDNPHHLIF